MALQIESITFFFKPLRSAGNEMLKIMESGRSFVYLTREALFWFCDFMEKALLDTLVKKWSKMADKGYSFSPETKQNNKGRHLVLIEFFGKVNSKSVCNCVSRWASRTGVG
uniref:Uncharacterized protein n=1 Tax=Nelumbo nucifera TaxID=4432 RepID=A0A822XPU6_NELNU|nr:TPA_asm: hypothetical protein HUJ06_020961 [Nelumbo nucifera]